MKNKKRKITTRDQKRDDRTLHQMSTRYVCINGIWQPHEDQLFTGWHNLNLDSIQTRHRLAHVWRKLNYQGIRFLFYTMWSNKLGTTQFAYVRFDIYGKFQVGLTVMKQDSTTDIRSSFEHISLNLTYDEMRTSATKWNLHPELIKGFEMCIERIEETRTRALDDTVKFLENLLDNDTITT